LEVTLSLDVRENMMSVRLFIACLVIIFATICKGVEGQRGPAGRSGPSGPAGSRGPSGHGPSAFDKPSCPERSGECLDRFGVANIRSSWTSWKSKRHWNYKSGNAKQECLNWCQSLPDSTGCEVHWHMGSNGCIAHLVRLSRANGIPHHSCWIFSECGSSSPKQICQDDYRECHTTWRTYCYEPAHIPFMRKYCRRHCGYCH